MSVPTGFDDVSVVMISRDEEAAIADVLEGIREHLPGAEVLLVDSSSDRTPEIAEEHGARVIRQFPPRGYGPAMERALLEPEREIIVTMDCDDTYPPDRLPELVERVRAGVDLMGTSRLDVGRPAAMPVPNYYANRAFNLLASAVFMRRIRDVHSGMRAYRRTMLHAIRWRADAPALPVELLLKPIRLGYRVEEISIHYAERLGETTLDRLASTVWTVKRIARSRFGSTADFRVAPGGPAAQG
jgi:glycosyltransferase involved in cell wall biosynthesis